MLTSFITLTYSDSSLYRTCAITALVAASSGFSKPLLPTTVPVLTNNVKASFAQTAMLSASLYCVNLFAVVAVGRLSVSF